MGPGSQLEAHTPRGCRLGRRWHLLGWEEDKALCVGVSTSTHSAGAQPGKAQPQALNQRQFPCQTYSTKVSPIQHAASPWFPGPLLLGAGLSALALLIPLPSWGGRKFCPCSPLAEGHLPASKPSLGFRHLGRRKGGKEPLSIEWLLV